MCVCVRIRALKSEIQVPSVTALPSLFLNHKNSTIQSASLLSGISPRGSILKAFKAAIDSIRATRMRHSSLVTGSAKKFQGNSIKDILSEEQKGQTKPV